MVSVYLDNNATTRTDPLVLEAMLPCFTDCYANPSSMHAEGRRAAAAMVTARGQVRRLIGAAEDSEIVFTASGTEADNLALAQVRECAEGREEIIVSAVEHMAVLAAARHEALRGARLHVIGVDGQGGLDIDAYRRVLGPRTALVSMMWANNETGVVFPIAQLAAMAHDAGALFHSDAVQAAGRLPIDVADGTVDLLSLSAHKLHGPKGVGALYVRKNVRCAPVLHGGRQERGRRAGTVNLPGIVGFGAAAELAASRLAMDAPAIEALRDMLADGIRRSVPDCRILGDAMTRLPGTLCVAFDGAEGEIVLDALDKVGIYASSGAACASGAIEPSHVVRAMRLADSAARGVVRFSLSRETRADDIDCVLARLPAIVANAKLAACGDSFF